LKIFYRVHVCGGDWLLYVTGYDVNDDNNGYADNDQKIDAVEAYYYSPAGMHPVRCAHYKVSPNLQSWYEEQIKIATHRISDLEVKEEHYEHE
jgi:hypothetical protein